MSGHLMHNFHVKAEYLLGHVHILTSYLMNTTMYLYCELLDLPISRLNYKARKAIRAKPPPLLT
jgi:hypothetical protein